MAGARSYLARWMGGASAAAPSTQPGFRSMVAFWMGGATSSASTPAPAAPTVTPSGGIPYDGYQRPKGRKDRIEERERLGIVAAEIVEQVAKRQVEDLHLDEQQRFEELQRELQVRGIEWQGEYLRLLNEIRAQAMADEIGRHLRAIALAREDEEIVFLMAMAALL